MPKIDPRCPFCGAIPLAASSKSEYIKHPDVGYDVCFMSSLQYPEKQWRQRWDGEPWPEEMRIEPGAITVASVIPTEPEHLTLAQLTAALDYLKSKGFNLHYHA